MKVFKIQFLILLFISFFNISIIQAATFTVTNTNDAMAGSLRQAILDANGSVDASDIIEFNIPGMGVQTIQLSSALPATTKPILIDGTTQPGYGGSPLIELDGTNTTDAEGLQISGGNSTVRSLIINHFDMNGILLDTNGGNTVSNCYIGTDSTGTADEGNGDSGVYIDNIPDNLIGGTGLNDGNLLSGNGGTSANGVIIVGVNATGNRVEGNLIGLDITGTMDLGNNNAGVRIEDATNNTVGGLTPEARNIISGNSRGVYLTSNADMNTVQGNYIGTTITGNASPGGLGNNSNCGILIAGDNNLIGGSQPQARNVISGNGGDGICFFGGALGINGNRIAGNYIGVNADGDAGLGNDGFGITNPNANDNFIGGLQAGEGNVISGNVDGGIDFQGQGADNNRVEGNLIGTNPAGTAAIPNTGPGIRFGGTSMDNTVGGTDPAALNVISGNTGDGVFIDGPDTMGHQILGNYIGTDISGTADLGNGNLGIFISYSPNNTLGGNTPEAANVVSGNDSFGIYILGTSATGNRVIGNLVGVDVNGTQALGNDSVGIGVEFTSGNFIGGSNPGEGNVVSANGSHGISVNDGADNHQVQGNYIGTDRSGALQLGNSGAGIFISSSDNNLIGGNSPESGNTILYNTLAGVLVTSLGVQNSILSNGIAFNDMLGIELASGGNNLQAPPAVTDVQVSGFSLSVQGMLMSAPNTQYRAQFFANTALDPSGDGEGETYLGEANIDTDGSGVANFSVTTNIINPAVDPATLLGQFLTATVTAPNGDTSPFSNGIPLQIVGALRFSSVSYEVNESDATAIITIERIGGTEGTLTVEFMTADGTAVAGQDYEPVDSTITFNPGETSKEIFITILDDDEATGDLTVLLNLLNPTGGAVVTDPAMAILTIIDDNMGGGGGGFLPVSGGGCSFQPLYSSTTSLGWVLMLLSAGLVLMKLRLNIKSKD